MYLGTDEFFTAADATATEEIDSAILKSAGRVDIALLYAGFSGTIDVQGKAVDGETWANVEYALEAATPAVAVAQISETTETSQKRLHVVNPPARLRVVMTRTAGSITGWAHAYATPAVLS